jgi:hypothetical protein
MTAAILFQKEGAYAILVNRIQRLFSWQAKSRNKSCRPAIDKIKTGVT